MRTVVKPGANFAKAPIRVLHSALTRASGESDYRSNCPACVRGILLVYRDQKTMALRRLDCCTLCAQHVFYLDAQIAGEALPPLDVDFTVN